MFGFFGAKASAEKLAKSASQALRAQALSAPGVVRDGEALDSQTLAHHTCNDWVLGYILGFAISTATRAGLVDDKARTRFVEDVIHGMFNRHLGEMLMDRMGKAALRPEGTFHDGWNTASGDVASERPLKARSLGRYLARAT